MPLFEFIDLALVQLAWLGFSGIWMLKRNDEIPLLISFLLFYVTGYRYWAITTGLQDWVNLSQFGITSITNEQGLAALELLVLAQSVFLLAYYITQRKHIPVANSIELSPFLVWLRPKVLLLGLFCLPLTLFVRNLVVEQVQEGQSLAYGVSGYLTLFSFVLVGIATLVMCLWKFGGLPRLENKVAAILIIIGVANLTFRASGRFQLIGWLATTAIILSASYKPIKRLSLLGGFMGASVLVFAVAGALRNRTDNPLAAEGLNRFVDATDANMLDGFVLLRQFMPSVTSFRWGMTHLEILLRPIPRTLWPDKPAGGNYLVDVGLSDPTTGFTLGISPTFFGDLYSEGGWFVMIVLAVLYGVLLAKLVQWTVGLQPFASVLIRAIICASLVPILRGGDLAGIVAWLGMAFWPCFLFLWVKRKDLRLPDSVTPGFVGAPASRFNR